MNQPISEAELIEIEHGLVGIEELCEDQRRKQRRALGRHAEFDVPLWVARFESLEPNVRRLIEQARAANAAGITESVESQGQGIANGK